MHVRWGEAIIVIAWLATWLAALSWAGVGDAAGLLIPIIAAGALPRIFRQLHPAPRHREPATPLRQRAGRLLLLAGTVAVLIGMAVEPPTLDPMTHRTATEEVEAFVEAWEATHGRPETAAGWEAERAALDRFTDERVRARKLEHETTTARRLVARPLGMYGGAALAVLGMALASGTARRRRQTATASTPQKQRRRQQERA